MANFPIVSTWPARKTTRADGMIRTGVTFTAKVRGNSRRKLEEAAQESAEEFFGQDAEFEQGNDFDVIQLQFDPLARYYAQARFFEIIPDPAAEERDGPAAH